MSSRKEEERIEKIIRGLMKLPPNRRCINCNSLGPQYVCTNFWTFVCMTCSGIHREFTHRVKSVSMSKFTFQEVEALQKGGNQRAREIFLEDWDLQRLRLPDSSNVDRVREFIKNVYVDKKYAGGKTSEKPPRDMQILRNHVDETRRASSYHSYSQSPPYDYQYEDRRYGKQGAMLTRKPGSDRGNYERKISGFIYSPGHLSEQMYEDRFANDGTGSRVSDYSVSSGGDPFRSGTQSPNFQKDIGFGSPPVQPSRENLTEDARLWSLETSIKRDVGVIPRPQRTSSSGSFGSFDSNFMSLKSVNSSSVMDVASEPEQSGEIQQHRVSTFPSLLQSSHSGNFNSFDPFEAPSVPLPVTSSASTVDLFQLQAASSVRPADSFQSVSISSASSVNLSQPAQISPLPSLDSPFQITQEQPPVTLDEKSPEFIVPKNEGWATFDIARPSRSTQVIQQHTPREMSSSDGDSLGKCNPMLSSNASMKWPSFQMTDAQVPSSSMSTPWDECLHKIQTSTDATSPTSWNAFEDSTGTLPLDKNQQSNKAQFVVQAPSPMANQYLNLGVSEDFKKEGTHKVVSDSGFFVSNVPSHVPPVPSYMPSSVPIMGVQSQATDLKSNNPFDLPFDSELESSNMFLNMSSLQAALPNDPLPSSFLGGVTETWFPKNQVTSYISGTPHGGLGYMAGQVPSSQLPNVPTQGHVASIGGNPFA